MTDRRRKPAPAPVSASRALTVQGEVSSSRPRGFGANPNRRTSAFLAHLALQYDGVAARRVQRSQRFEAAITGYETGKQMRYAPPIHDLKI